MRISKKQLRKIIAEIAAPGIDRVHRTMSGIVVPFGCEQCVSDIGERISDAIHARDACSVRSVDRSHYNGILNLLRRDKRAALKEMERRLVNEEY
jgi:hypothetical protein